MPLATLGSREAIILGIILKPSPFFCFVLPGCIDPTFGSPKPMEKWRLKLPLKHGLFNPLQMKETRGFFLWEKNVVPIFPGHRILGSLGVASHPETRPWFLRARLPLFPAAQEMAGFWLVRGTPKPSFLGVITHILGVSNLHFSWFWGPRVVRKTMAVVGSQVVEVETLTVFFGGGEITRNPDNWWR